MFEEEDKEEKEVRKDEKEKQARADRKMRPIMDHYILQCSIRL